MEYLESEKLKKNPGLYKGIKESDSWILREDFVFNYFAKNIKKDSNVLDIGCGNGAFLNKLKEMGYANMHGADIGNYLKNKEFDHQVVDLNREKLKWENHSFDVVTAFQVLEHLENYFLVLQEVSRVLKPGGLFFIAIPNQFNIFYRFKFFLTGNMSGFDLANNHLLFLTRDVFKKTYLKNFKLLDTFYRKGPVPMLGRLNIIPGVHFPAKTRLMPRTEWASDRVCFVLEKK